MYLRNSYVWVDGEDEVSKIMRMRASYEAWKDLLSKQESGTQRAMFRDENVKATLFEQFKQAQQLPSEITLDDVLWGSKKTIQERIEEARQDLKWRQMSYQDYAKAVEQGQLSNADYIRDDSKFDEANPEHPLASSNRFRRQDAADFFVNLASERPEIFTEKLIEDLHQAAFDCDAAVRLSTVKALQTLGNKMSFDVLKNLQQQETESMWVKKAAQEALKSAGDNNPSNLEN